MSDAVAAEPGSRGSRWIRGIGLLTLGVLTALIGFGRSWTPLQPFWFDSFQRMQSRTVESRPAIVVEIDEPSLAALGQWPWPRNLAGRVDPRHRALSTSGDRRRHLDAGSRSLVAAAIAGLRATKGSNPGRAAGCPPVERCRARRGDRRRSGRAGHDYQPRRDGQDPAHGAVPHDLGSPRRTHGYRSRHSTSATSRTYCPTSTNWTRPPSGHGLLSVADPEKAVLRRIPLVTDVHDTLTPALALEMLRVALKAPMLRLHVDGTAVQGISVGQRERAHGRRRCSAHLLLETR